MAEVLPLIALGGPLQYGSAMQHSYAIIWVARNKDRSGISPKRFSKEQAAELAADLNASHPEFEHATVDTAAEDASQALIALKERISGGMRTIDYSEFAAKAALVDHEPVDDDAAVLS